MRVTLQQQGSRRFREDIMNPSNELFQAVTRRDFDKVHEILSLGRSGKKRSQFLIGQSRITKDYLEILEEWGYLSKEWQKCVFFKKD